MMELLKNLMVMLFPWIVWPVILGIVAYWYLTRNHNYWQRLGIPYVPAIPILGSMAELFTDTMHAVELRRYMSKGRIYGAYELTAPVLRVGDPDILRNIFVKDFHIFPGSKRFASLSSPADKVLNNVQGEDWKRIRSIVSPAFSTGKIKKMTSIFIDSARTLTENFKSAAKEGKPIDMKRLFGAFTMDVITSSAFGTKIDSHNDPENPFAAAGRDAVNTAFPWRIFLFFLCPGFMRLFRISVFEPRPAKFFENVTLKILEERKRTKQRRNDFLQLLIDASEKRLEKDEEDLKETELSTEMGHEEENEKLYQSYQSSKSMSDIELVAQCIIFFLAGFETTTLTLSFTAYELAVNPDVQERLIAEIDEAIREKGELNYEIISEMKYLNNVISETLRKYPPIAGTERVAEEDYDLQTHNIIVPKGMYVQVPIYAIHHDPEHYPDPEKFDPDRFSPEQKSSRHPYAYLPFGAGPRNCVGMRFALMEIRVCLAYVLSKYRFCLSSKTQVPLQFHKGQGLLQPKEVVLNVEIRNDVVKY